MARQRKRWRRRLVGGVVGLTLGYLAAGYAHTTAARHQPPVETGASLAPVQHAEQSAENETLTDELSENPTPKHAPESQ